MLLIGPSIESLEHVWVIFGCFRQSRAHSVVLIYVAFASAGGHGTFARYGLGHLLRHFLFGVLVFKSVLAPVSRDVSFAGTRHRVKEPVLADVRLVLYLNLGEGHGPPIDVLRVVLGALAQHVQRSDTLTSPVHRLLVHTRVALVVGMSALARSFFPELSPASFLRALASLC